MIGVETALDIFTVGRSKIPVSLGQEAGGDGGEGVERDTELAKNGEKIGLTTTSQEVVIALLDRGENRIVADLDIMDDLSLCWGEIGKTEVFEFASRVDCPYRGQRVFDGGGRVGGVQIIGIHLMKNIIGGWQEGVRRGLHDQP